MMKRPRFSILVPVYNVEKYISVCIDSILAQQFTDYEVIIVDDGSTDESPSFCDRYAKKNAERIKVIHKTNGGPFSARREGLKQAKGQYICFLDSDDFFDENILQILDEIIRSTNSDIIAFKWKKVDENGNVINDYITSAFDYSGSVSKEQFFKKILSTSLLNSLCLKCCKYELFDVNTDCSSYYGIQNAEDLIQSLPLIENASSLYFLNMELYNYRVNTNSITHVYYKNQYQTLNVVRPLVYDLMCRLKYATDANVKLFYKMYLNIIWENLTMLYSCESSRADIKNSISEIKKYEYVKKAKKFLKNSDMTLSKRIGLTIFYYCQEINLYIYIKLLVFLNRIKNLIKRKSR